MIIAQSPRIPACFFLVDGTDVMTQIRWLWGNCVIYYQPGEDVFFTLGFLWRSTLSVEQMRSQLRVIHSLGEGRFVPKVFPFTPHDFCELFQFQRGKCYTHIQSNNMVHLRFSAPWKRRSSPNLQKNIIFRWTMLNFSGRVFTVHLWVVKITVSIGELATACMGVEIQM